MKAQAAELGITLMPWQETASKYLTAKGPDGKPLYREVAIVVARQNGKTTLVKPLIIKALQDGLRVMHIAQTRNLPRQMFALIASSLDESLFLQRRGKGGRMQTVWPRFGAGQEEILLANGGSYRIAASRNGGARGFTNDIVIIDELREMIDNSIIDAAESTMLTSDERQMIYLSNAGTDASVVLNDVRSRATEDPTLAYLEWSADRERATDDPAGWVDANPALGHIPAIEDTLQTLHRKHRLAGTISTFETENLCRWVVTMRARLVDEFLWRDAQVTEVQKPRRPFMAVSMDPSGTRAHAAIAWRQSDDTIALRITDEAVGDPIDTDAFGKHLRDEAMRMGVPVVGGDPMTDKALLRVFRKAQPISGQEWLNASARFVTALEAKRIRWIDCEAVTEDLIWTARKEGSSPGTFEAVRAKDDMPITAALAAVRAVWLASELTMTVPTGF